jgi:glycosyltransferase involved in cell wall biosynthesis
MAKKIAFIVDSIYTIGGVQRVTAVIAKALTKEYDVTIITLDSTRLYEPSLYGMNEVKDLKIKYFIYPKVDALHDKLCKAYSYLYRKYLPQCKLTSDLYAKSSLPNPRRRLMASSLNREGYDTIVAVHAFLAIRLATISPLLHCKCIGWIHNSFDALTQKGSSYLGPELKSHYGYQLKKLDAVVTLYHEDAQHYAQEYGLKVDTIYNPLTIQPGHISTGNSSQLLAVGRMTPKHKGFDILIDAFSKVMGEMQDWSLHIVGDGPEREKLANQIRKNHAEKQIILHPFTNDIQSYYQQAQLYVLSSRWEGMPLVLVEAMAHGLPIVASDLPTCKEVMGDNAIYFHTGDVNDLATSLKKAMTMSDWEERSRKSLHIANDFQVDKIIEKWKEIL